MSIAKLSTGVELYYEVHGKGETVVLLQGTGFACDVYREHPASDLKERYQVVIFDPRGVGRSSKVEHFFTIYQLAADTVSLLDHLKVDQAYILGHSIGGRIALAIATMYPGKVKSLFLAATGSGSPVRAGEDSIHAIPQRLLERLITRGLEEHVRYEIIEANGYFTEDFRKNHREVVTAFWKVAWEHHADLSTYLRYVTARTLFEISHQLGSIKAPAWIVCGDQDIGGGEPHVPQSRGLKERIPHAILKLLPNKSHGFFWQDPKGTKDVLLEWLEKSAI
jgi:pimeloyl-ACP methyl ester carboxylesterase